MMRNTPNLAAFSEQLQYEAAEIVVLNEHVARVGQYTELFFSFFFVENELHSLNTFYQQQHLYYWDPETREDRLTGAFRGEGYTAQEVLFLKRYAETAAGYDVAETFFLGTGGDPRVVSNGENAYAVHIVSDGTHLLHDLRNRTAIPILLPLARSKYGKNWQPFLVNNDLYIVHEMEPLRIIKLHLESGCGEVVKEIDIDFDMPCIRSIEPRHYPMFRGGSNALAVDGNLFGIARATSIGYRHSPFLWGLDSEGNFEVSFVEFFSEFFKRGYAIIDPTCLFHHEGNLYLGFCATERDWSHNQLVSNFLLVFKPEGEVDEERSLVRFFDGRRPSEENGVPNLDGHLFFCVEMPGATAHAYEHAGRLSTGEAGHLVHGPYVEIEREGHYCAELSYLTLSCPARRAGEFDVSVCRIDDAGEPVEFRTIGRIDLAQSHRAMAEARIQFDTTGLVGWQLETRVFVEKGVQLNAFHIRTWRCEPGADGGSPWPELKGV